jgi:hypothetical protein
LAARQWYQPLEPVWVEQQEFAPGLLPVEQQEFVSGLLPVVVVR